MSNKYVQGANEQRKRILYEMRMENENLKTEIEGLKKSYKVFCENTDFEILEKDKIIEKQKKEILRLKK